MKKNNIFKTLIIAGLAGVLIAGIIGFYMFNMPKRDVANTKADYALTSSQIVREYISDSQAANLKYLATDGDSRILEISGKISKISEDYTGLKVVLLKDKNTNAGVSCSFTIETSSQTKDLEEGDSVVIKGVIRSGASYDEDLELYENVILEKCSLIAIH